MRVEDLERAGSSVADVVSESVGQAVSSAAEVIPANDRPRAVEALATCVLWVTLLALVHRPLKNYNLTTLGLAIGALYSVCNGGAWAYDAKRSHYNVIFDWFDYVKAASFLSGYAALVCVEVLRARPRIGQVFTQLVWNANVLEAALYGPLEAQDYVVGSLLMVLCFLAPGQGLDEEGYIVPRTKGVGVCGLGSLLPYLPNPRTYYRLHFAILGTWYITSARWIYAKVFFSLTCIVPLIIIETRKMPPAPVDAAAGDGKKAAMSPEAYELRLLGIGALIRSGALVWMTLVFFFIDPGMTEYSTRLIFNYPISEDAAVYSTVKRNTIALVCILSGLGACVLNDRRIARIQGGRSAAPTTLV